MSFHYFNDLYSKTKLPLSVSSAIEYSHDFTSEKIASIRRLLRKKLTTIKVDSNYCVVAVGSYGRHDASLESDLDGYVISREGLPNKSIDNINKIVSEAAREANVKFSDGFRPISLDVMHKNIGGADDTNSSITNRILLLLESECLYNRSFYSDSYSKILNKYLKDFVEDYDKAPRFLLSDIIRYYRTICVDYEFKTSEQSKDWATRNIKLRFSRKGLYFGGIAILLNSLNKRQYNRYDYILKHLRLPFYEKISHILLEQNKVDEHKNLLVLYSYFLKEVSKKDVRIHLKKLRKRARKKDKTFKTMTEKADQFNDSLRNLLKNGKWGNKYYLNLLIL